MKKAKRNKARKVNLSQTSEELSTYESGTVVEELSCNEIERDCITEGDIIDDKNILSIKRLF